MAYRDPRILERLRCALSPPAFGALDNQLDTDAFLAGRGCMIGDIVEAPRLVGRRRRGEIVRLENLVPVGRHWRDRYFTKAALVNWGRGEKYWAPSRLELVERPRTFRKYFVAVYASDDAVGGGTRSLPEFTDDDITRSAFPDLTLPGFVDIGLAAIGLRGDAAVGKTAFERTIDQADSVRRIHPDLDQWNPTSSAMVEVFAWLARAFLGEPLQTSTLDVAIDALEQSCSHIPQGNWDLQGKCYFLETVMIAMLAGRMDKARQLLKSTRSFRDIEDLRWVLRKLCRKTVRPAADAEFMKKARGCFDLLRHPFVFYHREVSGHGIVVLLLTLLLETLVHQPGQPIDPRRVALARFA